MVVTAQMLRYPIRSALLAGLGLAQIGEFSFLLAQQGLDRGLMGEDVFQMFINTSILSMLAAPFLIQAGPWLTSRLPELTPAPAKNKNNVCSLTGHTIIAGYGLNGRNLAKTLKATHIPYVVLEVNADTIRKARDEGEPIIYGDITRKDVLQRAGVDCAKVIVFAISDFNATRMAVRLVRQLNPSIFILIRTRYAAEVDELYKLGADQVIPEEFETSDRDLFARPPSSITSRATSSRTRSSWCASRATRCCGAYRWTRRTSAAWPRSSPAPRWTTSSSSPTPRPWARR